MLETSLPLILETKRWIKDFYSTSVHQPVFSYFEEFDIFFLHLFINYVSYSVYLLNTGVVLNHAIDFFFLFTYSTLARVATKDTLAILKSSSTDNFNLCNKYDA